MNEKSRKFFLLDLIIALLGLLLDQGTKLLAVQKLKGQSAIPIISGVLELRYLENRGAAFGVFQNQKVFFVIMTCLIVAFFIYVLWHMPDGKKYRLLHVLGGVLIAGALGNFVDRIRLDYVIDFIYISIIDFPIFNVADMFISLTCAVGIILVFAGRYEENDFQFLKKKKAGGEA